MEKYVMEALFKMGEGQFGLQRAKDRFKEMVDDPDRTTLYEGWGVGERGFGGGTTNHAWSGGGQIVLTEYLFGLKPLAPGYTTFLLQPQPAGLKSGKLTIPTVKGFITVSFNNDKQGFKLRLHIPKGCTAIVKLPKGHSIYVNKKIRANSEDDSETAGFVTFELNEGKHQVSRDLAI
ncbi:hypothetical protein GCM10017764_19010 [Sphingobacterium griseoflavum]|uniref:Alpha-L-rhamnosidase C-terminal domain-containing protein n=2 Tax=Sphingobacterium griseoflavum TaxID=1474952 RepID=A0ABQ3HUJ4_9SPHI|nr:hypothetical protein GCM10017764_19010 [Sphingobacterium griseoflavum]